MINIFTDIYTTEQKFSIIYADPPWPYRDKRTGGSRTSGAAQVYDVMTIDQIKELPIKNITADNAILFLWITYPQLKNCFEVMEAWGFEYKTIGFQWIKLNSVLSGDGKRVYHVVESAKYSYFFGMGNWTRGNSETCLIGVKGKPKRVDAGISQLIFTERGAHSQKPAIARDLTVKLCGDLPRIELFARDTVPGWACWGDDPTL